jgi:hypothetical protein
MVSSHPQHLCSAQSTHVLLIGNSAHIFGLDVGSIVAVVILDEGGLYLASVVLEVTQ